MRWVLLLVSMGLAACTRAPRSSGGDGAGEHPSCVKEYEMRVKCQPPIDGVAPPSRDHIPHCTAAFKADNEKHHAKRMMARAHRDNALCAEQHSTCAEFLACVGL